MEDLKYTKTHLRLRPWLAGGVAVLSAVTAIGCGDSSDDKADGSAAKAAATTKATTTAASGAKTAAATPTTTAATPAASQPSEEAKKFIAQGTVRLMAKRLGWPGTLVVVSPKGTVDKNNERWYKPGTEVTVRATSTKTAHFIGWYLGCKGKAPVCKVTVKPKDDYTRVFASFELDQKAAKHLKKSDPRLQNGIFPDGSGPPKS
jgi:hypothetical protein